MIRSAILVLFLAGCAASTMRTTSSQRGGAVDTPQPEVHRGLLTNQKSSPDAPSDSSGGSTGGKGGL